MVESVGESHIETLNDGHGAIGRRLEGLLEQQTLFFCLGHLPARRLPIPVLQLPREIVLVLYLLELVCPQRYKGTPWQLP